MSKKKRKQNLESDSNAGQFTGRLVLVSLGIGNSQDVSLRALEALKTAEIVLAEDTREISKFYKMHELVTPKLLSYRDQNHLRMLPQVLSFLSEQKTVLLVSDRGTPAISDPGYLLVRDVLAAGFEVDSIPGPTALIDALVISGLPTDRFAFLGFLPRTLGKQKKILAAYKEIPTTLIAYESPFRVKYLLQSITEVFGDTVKVSVARELTKRFQQVITGDVKKVTEEFSKQPPKGEFVVLVDTRFLESQDLD